MFTCSVPFDRNIRYEWGMFLGNLCLPKSKAHHAVFQWKTLNNYTVQSHVWLESSSILLAKFQEGFVWVIMLTIGLLQKERRRVSCLAVLVTACAHFLVLSMVGKFPQVCSPSHHLVWFHHWFMPSKSIAFPKWPDNVVSPRRLPMTIQIGLPHVLHGHEHGLKLAKWKAIAHRGKVRKAVSTKNHKGYHQNISKLWKISQTSTNYLEPNCIYSIF